MLLNFLHSSLAQPFEWLSFQKLVGHIEQIIGKLVVNHFSCQNCLFFNHLISNFLSRFANVGTFASYKFVEYHPKGEIISWEGMILSAQDLWGHVPWSSTGLIWVLLFIFASDSQISNPYIAVDVKHEVFRLYISVYNIVAMKILKSEHYTGCKIFYLFLIEYFFFIYMISQVSSVQPIHYKVQVLKILEGNNYIHQKPILSRAYGLFS